MDINKNLEHEYTLFTAASKNGRSRMSQISIVKGWGMSMSESDTVCLASRFLKETEHLSRYQYGFISRVLAFLKESQHEFHYKTGSTLLDDFYLGKAIHPRSYSPKIADTDTESKFGKVDSKDED